jgi:hypothetical protein
MPVISVAWKVETGGWWFGASPGKKLASPCLHQKPSVVVCVCNSSYVGSIGWKIEVQVQPGANM